MNAYCFSWLLCFFLGWLGYICPTLSQKEPKILKNIASDRETLAPESNPRLNSYPGLIIGFWRGFHNREEMTLYYGYQFRANGTFLARHRLYEGEKTVEDDFWQGKWTFDGEILRVEGNSKSDSQHPLIMEFRLGEDLQLYHEKGSLAEPYFPIRLGKIK